MLKKILDYKILECEAKRRRITLGDMKKKAFDAHPAQNFLRHFHKDELNVIAEIKKASPSAGVFFESYDPIGVAEQYANSGAKAISILTDEKFFQGRNEDLTLLHQFFLKNANTALPLLRKDFTVHEYDLFEARAIGADAILLIVRALDDFQLKDYLQITEELGMAALVEVHDDSDMERALKRECKILGINSRDLDTLKTDIAQSSRLKTKALSDLNQIPGFKSPEYWIAESGLKSHEDLLNLHEQGFSGFLIGESLLKEGRPAEALRRLLAK